MYQQESDNRHYEILVFWMAQINLLQPGNDIKYW